MTDTITVRGIPVPRSDLIAMQYQTEGQLFDENMFRTQQQRAACANVLLVLDRALANWRKQHPDRDLPEYLDIGDNSWWYIPVHIFDPATVSFGATEKCGWFRRKKYWRVHGRQD